jgi:pyrroloquinoline quinone biosynthesis protein B
LLFDGTFWSEDEMQVMGVGTTPAAKMGHLPVGGPDGSLNQIASLPVSRRIYVHINNTNPILIEDSVERLAVESAGVEVGWDGLEFTL